MVTSKYIWYHWEIWIDNLLDWFYMQKPSVVIEVSMNSNVHDIWSSILQNSLTSKKSWYQKWFILRWDCQADYI